jgi:hypothetical protein
MDSNCNTGDGDREEWRARILRALAELRGEERILLDVNRARDRTGGDPSAPTEAP